MSDGRLVFVGGGAGRPLTLRTSSDAAVSFSDHLEVYTTDLPDYDGPTVVVPSDSAQTLSTEGTALMSDIVVQPIPSNWGRISYDGSTITVS